MIKNKDVKKHLKGDIKTFKKEAKEDRELIKKLDKKPKKEYKKDHHKDKHKKQDPKKHEPKKKAAKIEKVMHEWKEGELHSGSKRGPVVKNQKQAVAIALSEAKRAGEKVKPKNKKKK